MTSVVVVGFVWLVIEMMDWSKAAVWKKLDIWNPAGNKPDADSTGQLALLRAIKLESCSCRASGYRLPCDGSLKAGHGAQ